MTTFSITVDDVDVALLAHRSNDFPKKELYQFQVYSHEVKEPAFDSYMCHICAIDIPSAFASEHIASAKHSANARIASVAAQRTHALITAPPLPRAQTQPSARFCANCSTIVDDNHEKTKEHRVAVMLDTHLVNLMKAYVGDDDDLNDDNKSDEEDKSGNNKKDNNVGTDSNRDLSYDFIEAIDDMSIKQTHSPANKQIQNEEDNCDDTEADSINSDSQSSDEEYVSVSTDKTKSDRWVKIASTDENKTATIQKEPEDTEAETETKIDEKKDIHSPENDKSLCTHENAYFMKEQNIKIHLMRNGETLNTMSDFYHSFERKDYITECLLCDTKFHSNLERLHRNDSNHKRRVIDIGSDGDYIRQVDDEHFHCILCNWKIERNELKIHRRLMPHRYMKSKCTGKSEKTAAEAIAEGFRKVQPPAKSDDLELKHEIVRVFAEFGHPYEVVCCDNGDAHETRCGICLSTVENGDVMDHCIWHNPSASELTRSFRPWKWLLERIMTTKN